MTINELLKQLNKIPESQRDCAVHVFDERQGTYYSIAKVQQYNNNNNIRHQEQLSVLNPLLLVINKKQV